MYVQMLDIYRKYRKKMIFFLIFSKISRYFPTLIKVVVLCVQKWFCRHQKSNSTNKPISNKKKQQILL